MIIITEFQLLLIKYLPMVLAIFFSVSLVLVVHHYLSRKLFVVKNKNVFFRKSQEETMSATNVKKKKQYIDILIDKVYERIKNFFDVARLEKDIERANIKSIRSVEELVKLSFVYAFALGVTFFIARILILDMGIMIVLNIAAVIIGLCVPYLQVSGKIKKQEKLIKIEIPDVLDLIRQGIAAGLLFTDALKEARPKNNGPVDRLLKEVISKIQTSGDHVLAIYGMIEKINDEKIREFLQQLIIAYDADHDRQIEICADLSSNVRELEEVSKNIQIDEIDNFLQFWQYINVGTFSFVFLFIVLYDTFIKLN